MVSTFYIAAQINEMLYFTVLLKPITVIELLAWKLIVAHLKHCYYVCTCHVIAVRIMMILCFI